MNAIMCPSPVPPGVQICENNPRRQLNVYVRYSDWLSNVFVPTVQVLLISAGWPAVLSAILLPAQLRFIILNISQPLSRVLIPAAPSEEGKLETSHRRCLPCWQRGDEALNSTSCCCFCELVYSAVSIPNSILVLTVLLWTFILKCVCQRCSVCWRLPIYV